MRVIAGVQILRVRLCCQPGLSCLPHSMHVVADNLHVVYPPPAVGPNGSGKSNFFKGEHEHGARMSRQQLTLSLSLVRTVLLAPACSPTMCTPPLSIPCSHPLCAQRCLCWSGSGGAQEAAACEVLAGHQRGGRGAATVCKTAEQQQLAKQRMPPSQTTSLLHTVFSTTVAISPPLPVLPCPCRRVLVTLSCPPMWRWCLTTATAGSR